MRKDPLKGADPAADLSKVRISALLSDLGNLVLDRRRDLGLTQQDLADLAGVSRRSVIAIEHGSPTSLSTFLRILDVVGLQVSLRTGRSD